MSKTKLFFLLVVIASTITISSYTVAEAQLFEGSKVLPPPPPLAPGDGTISQGSDPEQILSQERQKQIVGIKHQIYNVTIDINRDVAHLVALEKELNTYNLDEIHLSFTALHNNLSVEESTINLNATSYTVGQTIGVDTHFYRTFDYLYHRGMNVTVTEVLDERVIFYLNGPNGSQRICTLAHSQGSYYDGLLPQIFMREPMCLVHPNGHITSSFLIDSDMTPGEYRVRVTHTIQFQAGLLGTGAGEYVTSNIFNITAPIGQ